MTKPEHFSFQTLSGAKGEGEGRCGMGKPACPGGEMGG